MANRTYVYVKTTAPGAGDDTNSGYVVGDRWVDTTADKEYVVLDVTASAAIWIEVTGYGDGWNYIRKTVTRGGDTSLTFPGSDADAARVKGCAFKWTDSGSTIRAVATNATQATGTVTVTLAGGVLSANATLTTVQYTHGHREIQVVLCDPGTSLTTGDSTASAAVPLMLNGWYVHWVHAYAETAPTGDTIIIQIANNGNDMLSTRITIDATENSSHTAAAPPVINTTYEQLTYGQGLDFDVDQVGSGEGGQGVVASLIVAPS